MVLFRRLKKREAFGSITAKVKKIDDVSGPGIPRNYPNHGMILQVPSKPFQPEALNNGGLPRWCGAGVSIAGGSVPTDVVVGFRIHDGQPEFILYQRRGGGKGLGRDGTSFF